MTYRLQGVEHINKSIKEIVEKQIINAVESLETVRQPSSDGIHEARKSFKKIRAVLRLIRPAIEDRYKRENIIFRDYGRALADWRDAKVVLSTLDQLKDHFAQHMKMHFFTSAQKKLRDSFEPVLNDTDRLQNTIHHIKDSLMEQQKHWDEVKLHVTPDDVSRGTQKIYKKARKAFDTAYAEQTGFNFHQWRKQVKYHWYHNRLLHDIWPSYFEVLERDAHELAAILGSEHDLTILREKLDSIGRHRFHQEEMKLLENLIAIQQEHIRDQARIRGMRLFAGEPGDLRKRLLVYMDAFKTEKASG